MAPPVRMGAAAVHEHQAPPAPLAPREVVYGAAVDVDPLVDERHLERLAEPPRRVGKDRVLDGHATDPSDPPCIGWRDDPGRAGGIVNGPSGMCIATPRLG